MRNRVSLHSSLNIQKAKPQVLHKNDQMGDPRRPRVQKEISKSVVRITNHKNALKFCYKA